MVPVMIFVVSCVKSREKCSNALFSCIVAVWRLGLKVSGLKYKTTIIERFWPLIVIVLPVIV